MDLKQLQSYKFVSVHAFCCIESGKLAKTLPILFPDHKIIRIDDPIRKINFKQKVKMGELEQKLHNIIYNIEQEIKLNRKHCVNFIPLFNILWMQLYKKVSLYLIQDAIELFKKIDLAVIPLREEVVGRNGDKSWFVKSKETRDIEKNRQTKIVNLAYDNNIKYISLNKLLQIAQKNNLWR